MLRLFLLTLLIFILQKPLFMLYNADIDTSIGWTDYFAVMLHGLPLDVTTTAYTLVIPWLVMLLGSIFPKLNIRKILRPYYLILSLLLAIVFVADTVMYSFWHFKLDSTIFLYTDKPAAAFASVSAGFLLCCLLAIAVLAGIYGKTLADPHPQPLPRNGEGRPSGWLPPHYGGGARRAERVFLLLLLSPILFLMIRGGWGESTANVTKAYYSENPYLNHASVNPAFSLF
jgi:hypothetical protein